MDHHHLPAPSPPKSSQARPSSRLSPQSPSPPSPVETSLPHCARAWSATARSAKRSGCSWSCSTCPADAAFELLRRTSQRRNIKVADLARTLVDQYRSGVTDQRQRPQPRRRMRRAIASVRTREVRRRDRPVPQRDLRASTARYAASPGRAGSRRGRSFCPDQAAGGGEGDSPPLGMAVTPPGTQIRRRTSGTMRPKNTALAAMVVRILRRCGRGRRAEFVLLAR